MKRPQISISTQPLLGKEYDENLVAVTCRPDGRMIIGTYTSGTVKKGYDGFVSGGPEGDETIWEALEREWKQETKTVGGLTALSPSTVVLYQHRLAHKNEPEKNTATRYILVGRREDAPFPHNTREMKNFRTPSLERVLELVRHASQYGFPQRRPAKGKRKENHLCLQHATMLALYNFAEQGLLPDQPNFAGWQGVKWEELEASKRS